MHTHCTALHIGRMLRFKPVMPRMWLDVLYNYLSLTYYVIFIQIAGPFMEHITAAGDLNNCTSGQKKYSDQSK